MSAADAITLSGLIAFEATSEMKQTALSSALVPGYRPINPVFKQTLLGAMGNKSVKSSFVNIASINRSLTEGKKKTTGFNLDIALSGPGYFRVRGGDGVVRFKRTIQGNIDPNTLEFKTAEGDVLLGQGGDILFPAGTSVESVRISQTGEITVDGAVIETLDIARFANEDLLKAGPNNTLEAVEAVPDFIPIVDDAGKRSTIIQQGMIEESGVQTPNAMMDMMSVFRHFQSINDFTKAEHKRQLDLIRKLTKPILA